MAAGRALGLLREPTALRRRTLGYVLAIAGPIVVTLCFLPFRSELEPITIGFVTLIVVVLAASIGRLGPGITASIVSFIIFNFFFLPPYDTFAIGDAEYVVSLFVFLGVSVLVSLLFARAADRAEAAEEREAELKMLQDLSRDLVVQGPGEETYRLLLEHLLDEFGFRAAGLFVQDEGEGLAERLAVGAPPGTLSPSWNPAEPGRAPERLPLSVGSRSLGLIVLAGERASLTESEGHVLRAVCDQLALVLERDRLLRRATEAEVLKQTDAVRRSMLAAVSHDLRSPLAAIKASVTDLLDPAVDREDTERDDALRTIDTETDRLDELVANLLDMSRIEAGVLTARPEHVDLVEVVTAEVDTVSRRWPGVRMDTGLDEAHGTVTADPVFLPRVLANLLDNGARAADGATRPDVEVTSRLVDGSVVVRVIDHGAGMDLASREQLFYPFYRLEERNTKLGPGLGLAIAKGFVDLMGGQLWVEDTPGGGATFAFSLPSVPSG